MFSEKNRFHLTTIKGIKINVDVSWLFIFALITWSLGAHYYPAQLPKNVPMVFSYMLAVFSAILMFGSILLHELSHSLVAIKKGISINGITLFIFGGVAQMNEEPGNPVDQFLIAAAGPLMSFILAIAFGGAYLLLHLGGIMPALQPMLKYLGIINFLLMVFNLAPGLPLDGGRIVMAWIWSWTGSLVKAARYASWLGQGIGIFMIMTGVLIGLRGAILNGVWLAIVGIFLSRSARFSYENTRMMSLIGDTTLEQVMTPVTDPVTEYITVRMLVEEYFLKRPQEWYPVVNDGEFFEAGPEQQNQPDDINRPTESTKENRDNLYLKSGEKVTGYVTISDVSGITKDRWDQLRVLDLPLKQNLTNQCLLMHPKDLLRKALGEMSRGKVRCVMVADGVQLLGTVDRESVMRTMTIHMTLKTED